MQSFEIASMMFVVTPKRLALVVLLSIVIVSLFRFALSNKRDLWFKRTGSTFFHLRGALGHYLSLGYPTCYQGYLVLGAIIICIVLASLLLLALPTSMI